VLGGVTHTVGVGLYLGAVDAAVAIVEATVMASRTLDAEDIAVADTGPCERAGSGPAVQASRAGSGVVAEGILIRVAVIGAFADVGTA